MLLGAFFLVATISVLAGNKYNVSVTVRESYNYYDTSAGFASLVGSELKGSQVYTIEVCADSPDEARSNAKEKCASMCRGEMDYGTKEYNGKQCKCTIKSEVYDAYVVTVESGGC